MIRLLNRNSTASRDDEAAGPSTAPDPRPADQRPSGTTGLPRPAAVPNPHIARLVPARDLRDFGAGRRWTDVRGWVVLDAGGTPVGTVARLLVELGPLEVRYFGIALRDPARADGWGAARRHVLVPVGAARRLDDRRAVALDRVSAAQLERAPAMADRPITRGDEAAALRALGLSLPADPAADPYAGPSFDGRALLGA